MKHGTISLTYITHCTLPADECNTGVRTAYSVHARRTEMNENELVARRRRRQREREKTGNGIIYRLGGESHAAASLRSRATSLLLPAIVILFRKLVAYIIECSVARLNTQCSRSNKNYICSVSRSSGKEHDEPRGRIK